jgi:nicotinamidase-related amidase
MLMTSDTSVLVLVDLQARLMPAIADGPAVLAQALRLAHIARLFGVPAIGTEQSPDKLGENVAELRQLCDRTLAKTDFDACAAGLADWLPAGRKNAVVAGCEAHVCMLQTALGLIERDYRVWVVQDAVGSRRDSDRQAALERLRRHGATVVTVEMVAFEWARRSDHPAFRRMQALVK